MKDRSLILPIILMEIAIGEILYRIFDGTLHIKSFGVYYLGSEYVFYDTFFDLNITYFFMCFLVSSVIFYFLNMVSKGSNSPSILLYKTIYLIDSFLTLSSIFIYKYAESVDIGNIAGAILLIKFAAIFVPDGGIRIGRAFRYIADSILLSRRYNYIAANVLHIKGLI